MASSSKVVRLSDSETKYLIDLYQGHDVLWNVCSKNYKNLNMREKALNSIIQSFEATCGIKLEVGVLKTKLQSFRNSFSKELTLIQESRRSGAGLDDIYTPKYPYFHDLLFLQHVMKKRISTTNLDDSVSMSQTASQNVDDEPAQSQVLWFSTSTESEPSETRASVGALSQTPASPSSPASTGSENLLISQEDTVHSGSTATEPTVVEHVPRFKPGNAGAKKQPEKRKHEQQEAEMFKNINSVLKMQMSKGKTEASPLAIWGQHVVSDISSIKDVKKQKRLRIQITRLVQDALEEELDD